LMAEKLIESSQPFAYNQLVIITPTDNPSQIKSIEDLARAKRLVIGTEHVPVGHYTRQLLSHAGRFMEPGFKDKVLANVVSEETKVRLIRTKVVLGEADAALVYLTDAFATEAVRRIAVPKGYNIRAEYLMARVSQSAKPQLAKQWQNFVASPRGHAILRQFGFEVN